MLRILTDNHYFAVSLDDLALLTDRLYGSSYFHFFISFLKLLLITPYDSPAGQVIR